MNIYLTDGIQGLDLGTGIYNLPQNSELLFTLSNIQFAAIGDGVPHILIIQIGEPPTSTSDVYRFYDANGNTVGNSVSIINHYFNNSYSGANQYEIL